MEELSYQDFLAAFGVGGAHPGGFALTSSVLQREWLKGAELLDVGCGTGQTSVWLAKEQGCMVTAIDHHPLMIAKAKRRFFREKVEIKLRQGDAQKLPFPGGTFDFLLSESVTIFTDISQSLSEYARVLRPGGVLLLLEMTAERPLSAKELAEIKAVYGTKQVPTEAEWRGRLQRAGFDSIRVICGGSVASALEHLDEEGVVPEFDPSPSIDEQLYEIGNQHQELVQKYSRRLGYRYYRAIVK